LIGGHVVAELEFAPAQAVNKLTASTGSIQRGTKLRIFYLYDFLELIIAFGIASRLACAKQDGQNRKSSHTPSDEAQHMTGQASF
jgi:hypothetical protein